jgi:hypothetical protein
VHHDIIKVFYSPTDAQVNCLKNNLKIYIKIWVTLLVAQLVGELRYKPEGRGFDSR